MKRIQNALVWVTKTWWALIVVFALNFATFGILFSLEAGFESITEMPVFDTQNDLTADQLRAQLPLYTGEAAGAYWRFWAFDFFFPFMSALFLAVVWTLFLRLNTWSIAQRLLALGLPLLVFVVTLFDWGENTGYYTILTAQTVESWMIDFALTFKRLKLIGLSASGAITGVLFLLWIVNVVMRVASRRKMP